MFKTTNKQVYQTYRHVYKMPYGKCQQITHVLQEVAYNSGIYGWNYTIYQLSDTSCICTGYRPIGEDIPSNIVDKIEYELSDLQNKTFKGIILCDDYSVKVKAVLERYLISL